MAGGNSEKRLPVSGSCGVPMPALFPGVLEHPEKMERSPDRRGLDWDIPKSAGSRDQSSAPAGVQIPPGREQGCLPTNTIALGRGTEH